MFAWLVGDVDWATGDAARGCVEGGVGVGGLEHVPVWEDVEEAGEEGVVGITEDVPWVACFDCWEEVV